MHSVEYPLSRAPIRTRQSADTSVASRVTETADIRTLRHVKEQVPLAQRRLGGARWSRLVESVCARPNDAPQKKKVASRAYYKMREMLQTCAIESPRRSAHLCESPGGFVQAVGDAAVDGWTWKALSLNEPGSPLPCDELLPTDRGEFVSGNVFDLALCRTCFEESGYDLVTADGAHDVVHSTLEEDHLPLLVAQVRVAVHALAPHGTLVFKFFEGFQAQTLHLIALMTQMFDNVSVIKPSASRVTNSERYLVARDFEAHSHTDVPDDLSTIVVASEWIRDTQEIMDSFARSQATTLRRVIATP